MKIEENFIQKAIEDRNYISFTYKNKKISKIKPLQLVKEDSILLKTSLETFDFRLISKIVILKEKF